MTDEAALQITCAKMPFILIRTLLKIPPGKIIQKAKGWHNGTILKCQSKTPLICFQMLSTFIEIPLFPNVFI